MRTIVRSFFFVFICYATLCQAQIATGSSADLPSCLELENKRSTSTASIYAGNEASRPGAPTLGERALYKTPNREAWNSFNAAPQPLKAKLPADLKSKYILPSEILPKPPGLPKDIDFNDIIRKRHQLEKNRSNKSSSLGGGGPVIGSAAKETVHGFGRLPTVSEEADMPGTVVPSRLFKLTAEQPVSSEFKRQSEMVFSGIRPETQQIGLGAVPVPGIYQKIKIPELKKGEGVAVGEVNKVRCWRYGEPNDAERVNPVTQTTNLAFDPFGFREIGVLVIIFPDNKAPDICSFVIVDVKYLLTATHCLWRHNPLTQKPDSVSDAATELLWLYPKKNNAAKDVLDCIHADRKSCGFHTLEVSAKFHAPDLYFDGGTANWHQDIALVELAKPIDDSELTPASLPPLSQARSFYLPPRSKISIAGYGGSTYQASGLKSESGNLSVGHQVLDGQFSYEFVWRKSVQVAVAGACYGDSGGPVYSDWTYGKDKEEHLVVGINSRIKLSKAAKPSVIISNVDPSKFSPEVQQCVSGEMSNSAQLVSTALSWVCLKTNHSLPSCKL